MRRGFVAGLVAALVVALLLGFLPPASPAHAGDGRLQWFTIESEHFVVTYHRPLGAVARRVVVVAERAHENLASSMGHTPDDKTLIVVDDKTDSSNGSARVLPRNLIKILISAPASKSDLADHDDWLYGLVSHEYAHILHLDNIGGLPKLVNSVVGKSWAPNQVLPRWVVEGLATYEESKKSSSGRLRSATMTMNMRIATLSGDERSLDEMSNGPRAWPHGNTAYLYGSRFLAYVFDEYGESAIAKMSETYGRNPIPYALSESIRRATGRGFDDLYAEWKSYRRDRYALERESVERAGVREGRRLTFSGEININPRYSRDGNDIIWQHGPGVIEGRYESMPSGGLFAQRKTYAIVRRGGEFDLLADGSMILEQTDVVHAQYISQELFRWDAKTESMHRLTKRVRLRDPAVSPDERQVAFVTTARAERRLMVMDLAAEATPRLLWKGSWPYDQAFDPAWSPGGRRIAFSAWRKGGFRDILIVDVASGELVELSHSRSNEVDPVFDPRGRYLYFASDRTGIYNIFAYEFSTGLLQQVTNVLGGAVAPTVSPSGRLIAYQGYLSKGYEIYEMLLEPDAWGFARLYVNDRPDSVEISEPAYTMSQPRPYRPLETLAPDRYDLQLDAPNRRLNVAVQGSDVVGHHRYTLGGAIDLQTGRGDIGGSYSNNRYWAGFRFAANRTLGDRGGFVIAGRNTTYLQERIGTTLSVSVPVLREPDGSASLSLSYDYDYIRDVRNQYSGPDPSDLLPNPPEADVALAGIALRFSYSDTQGFVYTLGPQLGKSFSLSMRLNDPALGSAFRSINFDYRLQTYYKLPWGQTPVLSLRLSGGIRASGRRRVSRFSLGGVPKQEFVRSILDNARVGTTGFLRGYGSRTVSGRQMHLANLEYRQEIWNIEKGVSTLPFYIKRLHVAGLLDVGDAFEGAIDATNFKTSLGVSLRLDMLVGYFIPATLDMGYARGLSKQGIHEWWALLTGSI